MKEPIAEPSAITLDRIIPAPPSVVFEAWLRPEALAVFIRPAPGVTLPQVEVDAQVGGKFLILMRVGTSDKPHRGEYRIIDRYRRLQFTWHSDQTSPESLVTLDFEALEADRTRLTLHHVLFPNETSRSNHEKGWTAILSTLAQPEVIAEVAEGRDFRSAT